MTNDEITLRLPTEADQDFIRALEELPDVKRRLGGIGPNDRCLYYRVIHRSQAKLGIVGIVPSMAFEAHDVELICVVHPDHEGRGIATWACKAALDDYGPPKPPARMLASIVPENLKGRSLVLKLGFHELPDRRPNGDVVFLLPDRSLAQDGLKA